MRKIITKLNIFKPYVSDILQVPCLSYTKFPCCCLMQHATSSLGNRHRYFQVSTYYQDARWVYCCKACCIAPRKIHDSVLGYQSCFRLPGRRSRRRNYSSQHHTNPIIVMRALLPIIFLSPGSDTLLVPMLTKPSPFRSCELDIAWKPEICRGCPHLRALFRMESTSA